MLQMLRLLDYGLHTLMDIISKELAACFTLRTVFLAGSSSVSPSSSKQGSKFHLPAAPFCSSFPSANSTIFDRLRARKSRLLHLLSSAKSLFWECAFGAFG